MNSIGDNPYSWTNKLYDLFFAFLTLPTLRKVSPSINDVVNEKMEKPGEKDLCDLTLLMDTQGSDKGSVHSYTEVYQEVLSHKRFQLSRILEIGIGSTDLSIPSNMGKEGKPGASLRGWKIYAPNAQIFGADVDEKVLFSENGIHTFKLNQLEKETFDSLLECLSGGVDLVIIDGLHTLRADLNSLIQVLPYLKNEGNLFIEDVGNITSKFIWPTLLKRLEANYSWQIYYNPKGNLIHITRHTKRTQNFQSKLII